MSVRNMWVVIAVVAAVFAGCSSDPTTSDEYRALETERAALEADLASVEAERAALETQVADLEAAATETAGS
jgi:cell division protein FtsB